LTFHKRKGSQKPETLILNAIKEYLQWRGFFVYRNQQNIGSHRGLADLTALKAGLPAIYVEVKSAKGKLSPDQIKFADNVVNAGHCYFMARSVEEIENLLPKETL
jgi:hypothetical protein